MHKTSTHKERILAALAHAGIIANGFYLLGIIGATLLFIWSTYYHKSRYIGDHALQALLFQWFSLLFTLLILAVWGTGLTIAVLPALLWPGLYPDGMPVFFQVLLLIGAVIFSAWVFVVGIYGLAGAFAAWRGQEFHYLAVGSVLALLDDHEQPQAAADNDTTDPPGDTADPPSAGAAN